MSRTTTEGRRGPYRSRHGVILGVCRGIADYTEISVFWVRVIVLFFMVFTGFWPVVALYFLAALLMRPEPVVPFQTEADEEFYNSFTTSHRMALRRLKRTFDALDRRIRRMEATVTSREYDWRRRLNGE